MLRRNIIQTFSGSMLGMCFSFLATVIIARCLGPANQGLISLAMLIPMFVVSFCIMGQETVNSSFAGLYPDKRKALFLQTLLFTIFGTVICVLVTLIYYYWLPINRGQFEQIPGWAVWAGCLFGPVTIFFSLTNSLLRGVGKIGRAAFVQAFSMIIFFLFTVVLIGIMKRGIVAAIIINAVSPFFAGFLAIWYLRDYITFSPSELSFVFFKKTLKFGGIIGFSALASFLIQRIGHAILGYFVSADELGQYAIATSLAERLALIPGAISVAFLPRLSNELAQRQSQVPDIFRYSVIISFLAMFIAGILGIPAILLIFGRAYQDAIPSFLLLLPGIAALGGGMVLSSDLLAREKPRYAMYVGYSMLVINIALNFLFIPFMGIDGAAIARSISYIVATILWIIFFLRVSGRSFATLVPQRTDFTYILKICWEVFEEMIFSKFKKIKKSIDAIKMNA